MIEQNNEYSKNETVNKVINKISFFNFQTLHHNIFKNPSLIFPKLNYLRPFSQFKARFACFFLHILLEVQLLNNDYLMLHRILFHNCLNCLNSVNIFQCPVIPMKYFVINFQIIHFHIQRTNFLRSFHLIIVFFHYSALVNHHQSTDQSFLFYQINNLFSLHGYFKNLPHILTFLTNFPFLRYFCFMMLCFFIFFIDLGKD